MIADTTAHEHRVTVVLHLDCGHVREYPLPDATVGENPAYAAPGTPWHCQACSATFPSRRTVTAVRYDYGCEECEAVTSEPDACRLPQFQPYQWAHDHGLYDVAGYVIVRGCPNGGAGRDLADVATLPGASQYGRAVELTRKFAAAVPRSFSYAIVAVYADGCRTDRKP
ncbi:MULTISPECIES: hypothetical protein [unclassified Amycolatopsis]|uniref:hypothetical protein n=1 Tax=unclassified Amycolatopsis TaxID=2618356 RepID=UPI0028753D58|nr:MULTISPECIES: hypothetical protein [unclassified Amycolatopsis]MDS0140619.1 hypothetical protein [Amycolatopsis sp. 505]MDS0149269.1 hypothetical protein [Amycolatopsis sp. CM201R]